MSRWLKSSASVLVLTALCFALGVLIVAQLRSTGRAAALSSSSSDQARVLSALVDSNDGLRSEIGELQAQIERMKPTDAQARNAALMTELSRLVVITGSAVATGPGVRVIVSGQINPLDMQDLINELRNSGAEAMDINGNRIVVRSVVTRDDANLALDGQRLTSPYVLEAIGQPDTIEKALLRKGGLVDLLEYAYPGLSVTISKVDTIYLPAVEAQPDSFRFAQPAP
jgi:uncharacterized protein YlxW (UPF0749 family)